jgi:hypothetical protein
MYMFLYRNLYCIVPQESATFVLGHPIARGTLYLRVVGSADWMSTDGLGM